MGGASSALLPSTLQGIFELIEGPSGTRNFDIKIDEFWAGVWCVPLWDQNQSWFTGKAANRAFKAINGIPNFQIFPTPTPTLNLTLHT